MRRDAPAPAARLPAYLGAALAASLVNLAAQEAARRWVPGGALAACLAAGTLAGFLAKYGLDKWLVFADPVGAAADELRKLALYGAFSVGTTGVFWATEIAFWRAWGTPEARLAGAALGLAVGYGAKFALDRAFVFRRA